MMTKLREVVEKYRVLQTAAKGFQTANVGRGRTPGGFVLLVHPWPLFVPSTMAAHEKGGSGVV
jgi:hypothetical protein